MHLLSLLQNNIHSIWPTIYPQLNVKTPRMIENPIQKKSIACVAAKNLQVSETQPKKKFSCSVVPTLNCADTQQWRKCLILAAQYNIVISGNYCGGKALDDILELIDHRMSEVVDLQVLIIGHPEFIADTPFGLNNRYFNKSGLAELFKKYPTRFYFVESPDIYRESKKTTNHAKFTIIDFGTYSIQGGSGIKDNFVHTGLDHLTVEKFLETEWKQKTSKPHAPIPGNFRDQDFVFCCQQAEGREMGKKMYRQALFLAYKWDRYKKDNLQYLPSENWELDDLQEIRYPALTDAVFAKLPKIHENECVLYRMLKRPIPNLETMKTKVNAFAVSTRKVHNVQIQLFFTGPETSYVNLFIQEMVERIHNAIKEIMINHAYFQPPGKLMNALIAAVKRGVKLTIITAGVTKNCPNGQKISGPKNALHYTQLFESLKEQHALLRVYEFEQNKKGLHKKVVIIDDYIFAGSSNMDHKCCVLMGDHETNFIAQSQALVDQTMSIIQEDIQHSRHVQLSRTFKSLSF